MRQHLLFKSISACSSVELIKISPKVNARANVLNGISFIFLKDKISLITLLYNYSHGELSVCLIDMHVQYNLDYVYKMACSLW